MRSGGPGGIRRKRGEIVTVYRCTRCSTRRRNEHKTPRLRLHYSASLRGNNALPNKGLRSRTFLLFKLH
ncbi:Hypothetical protein NTJ_02249 [Nesidiocoris tenuis]|uniref:60S ribosomal protein L34 n=1 Tax=Nesidiocoris tenuis TaxID=355587 RepID=A0ABN7AAU4_9HEMI|nr:Hypothetical protein NTJ_02249 [Nesidiocoris tenuis]